MDAKIYDLAGERRKRKDSAKQEYISGYVYLIKEYPTNFVRLVQRKDIKKVRLFLQANGFKSTGWFSTTFLHRHTQIVVHYKKVKGAFSNRCWLVVSLSNIPKIQTSTAFINAFSRLLEAKPEYNEKSFARRIFLLQYHGR